MEVDVIFVKMSSMVWRAPDGVARSALARSGVQHENRPRSGSIFFLKNWILDRRGGFAAACPGHEAAKCPAAKGHLCRNVTYADAVIYGIERYLCLASRDRMARSAIGVQYETGRAAAQDFS